VETGETPREGALREPREETGLLVQLQPRPAAVTVRSYRPGWEPTLGLSYAAFAGRDVPLTGEPHQWPAWQRLAEDWASVFPEDGSRMRAYLAGLGGIPAAGHA
jgi:8-oxo-dGTP diphosphatase